VGFDCADKTARIWRWNGTAPTVEIPHDTLVPAISVSPDGKTVALVDEFRVVKLYDAATGKQKAEFNRSAPMRVDAGPVQFSPDGRDIAAGDDTGATHIWRIDALSSVRVLKGDPKSGASLAYSRDGKLLAVGGVSGGVDLWDAASGKRRASMQGRTPVPFLAFSPDGKRLATSGMRINLWDLTTFTRTDHVLDGRIESPDCFSTDGRYFTAFLRSEVYVYDARTWSLLHTFQL
jgi:WD40 repeat protein